MIGISKELDKTKLEADTITDIAKTLAPYYRPGHRDSIIFSITGPLFKGRTPNQTIKNMAQRLVDLTNYPDENINKIFDTIDQKYTRNPDCFAVFLLAAHVREGADMGTKYFFVPVSGSGNGKGVQ